MKGKRLFAPVIIVLAIAVVLAVPLAGCAGGVSFPTTSTTPSLSQATTCKSVNPQTGEPIEPTTTFTPDTLEIFGSAKLSNAPAGTEIKSEWIYVPEDLLIDSWSTSAEGTQYLSSSITRPDGSWPTGDYKLVFYLNSKEAASVSFKVQ
jgi:hypothetical protein